MRQDPLRVAFYAGGCIPIHAYTLQERPLGGTETGVIRLSEALHNLGADVTVFSAYKDPPPSVPRYTHYSTLASHKPFDVLVLVQEWRGAFFNLPAKKLFFLTGDGPEIYSTFGLGDPRTVKNIDSFLAVSNYHATSLCQSSGFPIEKTTILGNGVHLPFYTTEVPKIPRRIIYTSAPYRGLAHLVPMLRRLTQKFTDLEFHAFSGMSLYARDKKMPETPQTALTRELATALHKIPGCFLHDPIPQEALAVEYLRSSIFAYPCTVPETCCITALEAQAAGCACLVTDIGALRETIGTTGMVTAAGPLPEQLRSFEQQLDYLLSNPSTVTTLGLAARKKIFDSYSWDQIAQRFLTLCQEAP